VENGALAKRNAWYGNFMSRRLFEKQLQIEE
jgi:hypothetical protein